jgi:DNA-directed RNA polymerase specialized sigma24 family protein
MLDISDDEVACLLDGARRRAASLARSMNLCQLECESAAGFAVAMALNRWRPGGKASLRTFVMRLVVYGCLDVRRRESRYRTDQAATLSAIRCRRFPAPGEVVPETATLVDAVDAGAPIRKLAAAFAVSEHAARRLVKKRSRLR